MELGFRVRSILGVLAIDVFAFFSIKSNVFAF